MIIYSSMLTKAEMDFDVSTTAQLKETDPSLQRTHNRIY